MVLCEARLTFVWTERSAASYVPSRESRWSLRVSAACHFRLAPIRGRLPTLDARGGSEAGGDGSVGQAAGCASA